ncbi:MAG: ABC transporter substrate-binding protein, partial [Pseudomonadota bacterium]|nr:ABC transporter substrate-binding protein [Pseudomonadota bacterium]
MNCLFVRSVVLTIFSLGACTVIPAQERDLLIGASLPLTGPNAAAGQEGLAVANAVFESVNKAGGIHGRRIVLKALDDGFNPQTAAANARRLSEDKVLALFNCWGTSSCSAMMPVVNEQKVAMIAGIAGGGIMQADPGRYAFNVRPTTEHEIRRMVSQMTTVGQRNIAVVYQADGFGQGGLISARSALSKAGIKPSRELALEADAVNAGAVIAELRKAEANGVILIASPAPTVKLISQARQTGMATPFYNLAAQANQKVVADLGKHTQGAIFTTLVPSPWRIQLPVAKEYQQLYSAATGKNDYSYIGLEVFINATLLVEGLRG